MKKTRTYTLEEFPDLLNELKPLLAGCKVITLEGALGAGKTTLVKRLLKAWGVKELVSSPTFTYVQHYSTDEGTSVYHFDLYRVPSLQAFDQLGFQEYLYQPNSIAFIEWPEVIEPLLHKDVCRIVIEHGQDPNNRTLHISKGKGDE